MNKCGLVLLAAGASRRLGQAKQLLTHKNRSFLTHSLDVAMRTMADPVIVVYGANAALIEPELAHILVPRVFNDEWERGISASIKKGLSALLELCPSLGSVVFMVCDQPFVTTPLLNAIISHAGRVSNIVACRYGDTYGTPALFGKNYFADLLGLQGDEGAKKIIKKYERKLETVSFPMGHIDVDTPEDYELLNILNNNGIDC